MLTAIKRVLGLSNEDVIGSVSSFAGSYSPYNTIPCEGQLLPIGNNQYTKLFSIIGTIYGGDGLKTFAIPDLRPTDKKGLKIDWAEAGVPRQVICVEGIYPQRP
jgi:microcystin-dependent protein